MANRNLQAKRNKLKRKFLPRFSEQVANPDHIQGNPRMRRAYLKAEKHLANPLLMREFHGSAKTLSEQERFFFRIDHIPDDVTRASQNARRDELGLPSGLANSSREVVLAKMRAFIEEPIKHSVVLINSEVIQVLLFWNVGQHQFWFVKKDLDRCELQKSVKYSSRDKAMRMFKLELIKWIARESIR